MAKRPTRPANPPGAAPRLPVMGGSRTLADLEAMALGSDQASTPDPIPAPALAPEATEEE